MKSHCTLVNRATGEVAAESLEVADTYWRRLIGLQFRRELAATRGLLLVPCSSMHTFCMRFAIDVVWMDRTGEVIAVRQHVRPWRVIAGPRGTYAALELLAGTARVRPGDRLRLLTDDDCELSRLASLHFLR
jgi:uncharacterized membrane protein (UPF0127 family)